MSTQFSSRSIANSASALLVLTAFFASFPSFAGRPLTVDDANVNDTGDGHVEAWWTRSPNGVRSWTVAPAYAPVDNIELGAGIAREQFSGIQTQNIQAKFRLSPTQENGCNFGAVTGYARVDGQSSQPYVNGLFSCNHPSMGSLHTNLGALNFSSSQRVRTWGVAWERTYGEVTVHIEKFGMEHEKPTTAVGLRFNVMEDLQLDTSVGRTNKNNIFTLGFKWMF
jgi:hypothetical protein